MPSDPHLESGGGGPRERDRLQSKLPGVMKTRDNNKLRQRLAFKNELLAAFAEFCGTFSFLFFAFGIVAQADPASANGDTGRLLYASLGFG